MQQCNECGQVKRWEEFYRNSSVKTGRQRRCIECSRSYSKVQHIARQNRAHHKKVASGSTGKRPSGEGWARFHAARAAQLGLMVRIDQFTCNDVVARYGDQCFLCGGPFETLDHWVPVSAGGEHTLANVSPMCKSCNPSKGRIDKEWAALAWSFWHAERVADGLADQGEGDGPGTVVEGPTETEGAA